MIKIILFALISGLLIQFSFAQDKSVVIKIKLNNESGDAISDAHVKISDIGIRQSPNSEGIVSFEFNSSVEKFKVEITASGYEKKKIDIYSSDFGLIMKVILKEDIYSTDPIVVTGTKRESNLSNSTLPASIISQKQIKNQDAMRLTDLLSEQTGLSLTNFLGAGVQIQGLDPDYTLIMVDGEPLIGRQAGTIDLSRISVGNIKQVEIVKGPSSSLYGSEAMAGVINILTKNPSKQFGLNLGSTYGTFNTVDVNTNVQLKDKNFDFVIFLDRISSSGYDLFPESQSQTSPQYSTLNISPKLKYNFGRSTNLTLSGSYYLELQDNVFTVSESGVQSIIDDNFTVKTLGITPKINFLVNEKVKVDLSNYYTSYSNNETSTYQSDGSTFEDRTFDEYYNKSEALIQFEDFESGYLTGGAGYIYNKVNADYIADGTRSANNSYAYIQQEWIPLKNLTLIAGARFDNPSDYDSRLSPKVSANYKPFNGVNLRSSFGSGFKAPSFQQLYLDFSNPAVGYSVFGASVFQQGYSLLVESGQISQVLIDVSSTNQIQPEISSAIDLGTDVQIIPFVNVGFNFFRNDIDDMIEVLPVAKKTNGQNVFTYFNLNRIYTQGFEVDLNIDLPLNFSISSGYQYVEAFDKSIQDSIENKRIYKIGGTGVLRPVQMVEYGGLFNRPKHSGNIKLLYDNKKLGLSTFLRGVFKSRYGYADLNSNLILDNNNEYIQGYGLWNFTVTKSLWDNFSMKFNVENIFDKTNAEYIPELPGRKYLVTLNYSY